MKSGRIVTLLLKRYISISADQNPSPPCGFMVFQNNVINNLSPRCGSEAVTGQHDQCEGVEGYFLNNLQLLDFLQSFPAYTNCFTWDSINNITSLVALY